MDGWQTLLRAEATLRREAYYTQATQVTFYYGNSWC